MFAQSEPTAVSGMSDTSFWQDMLKTATEIYGVIAINESQAQLAAAQPQQQDTSQTSTNQPIVVEVSNQGAQLNLPKWVMPIAVGIGGFVLLRMLRIF